MPLSEHDKQNFDTLKTAFQNGDVALMECQLVSTGLPVPVICAVSPHEDGSHTFIPFAMLFSDNPYTTINPPHPDHEGFVTQDEIWLNALL